MASHNYSLSPQTKKIIKQISDKAVDSVIRMPDWVNSTLHPFNPGKGIDFLDLSTGFPADHSVFVQLQDLQKMTDIINRAASEVIGYDVQDSTLFIDEMHYDYRHTSNFCWHASVAVSQNNSTLNRHEIRFYTYAAPHVKTNLDNALSMGSACTFLNENKEKTRGLYINILKDAPSAQRFSFHETGHHIQDSIMQAPSGIVKKLIPLHEIDQYKKKTETVLGSADYFNGIGHINPKTVFTYTKEMGLKKQELTKEIWNNTVRPCLIIRGENQNGDKDNLYEVESSYRSDIREVFANEFASICQATLYRKVSAQKKLKV